MSNTETTDTEIRFSLLDLSDAPRPVTPECPNCGRPQGVTADCEVCAVYRRHQGAAAPAPVTVPVWTPEPEALAPVETPNDVDRVADGSMNAEAIHDAAEAAPAGFEAIAAEGARMGELSGFVRGRVRREDVNPIAGYNAPVVAREGEATRYADESRYSTPATAAEAPLQQVGATLQQLQVEAETHVRSLRQGRTSPTDERPQVTLRRGELVAGGAAAGNGVLLSWDGAGELPGEGITGALAAAELPTAWRPATKSAHRHAGLAISGLSSSHYVPRAITRAEWQREAERAAQQAAREHADSTGTPAPIAPVTMPAWKAAWVVQSKPTAKALEVGAAAGKTVLVAELHDNELRLRGDIELAARVRAEFDRAAAGEIYKAGEITSWLREVLVSRFAAVKLGGSYYVPRMHAVAAERLCTALAARWGSNWMLPAIPLATSEQLIRGIAAGLAKEVIALHEELQAARQAAGEAAQSGKRKAADLTSRAAAAFVVRLEAIGERARTYAAVLGPDHLASICAAASAMLAEVQQIAGDTELRGALIWDELADEDAPAPIPDHSDDWRRRYE